MIWLVTVKNLSNDIDWNCQLIDYLFDINNRFFISKLRNSNDLLHDKIMWTVNKSRIFAIKSAHSLLVKEDLDVGALHI